MPVTIAPPGASAEGASEGEKKGEKEGEEDESEGKGLVPIHNGAIYDNYRWTQSLQDLQASRRHCWQMTAVGGVKYRGHTQLRLSPPHGGRRGDRLARRCTSQCPRARRRRP